MTRPISPPPEARRGLFPGGAIDVVLPVLAVVVFVVAIGATIAVAADTLGYDFLAYHGAAVRILNGQPAYDTSYQVAGPSGLFFYAPTFIPLVLAFGLLPASVATAAWLALMLGAFAAGVALMPVSPRTRWLVLLLAGQSWPFLYTIKLGQVSPLLFLLFVVGWRWVDRPRVLGVAGALGAAIKLQPGLVLAWALLTRRWTAVAAGAAVLVALAAAGTILVGIQGWSDFLLLVGRTAEPITTPHNFTPGAVAYQYGASRELASAIQWVAMGLVVTAVVVSALRLPAVSSYLVAVVASQLLSPILWDHYAMLLLLPVAWLVDRGHRWAVGVVFATSVVLVGVIPAWVYPMAYVATLVGLIGVGSNMHVDALGPPLARWPKDATLRR